jgi:polyisoprenoid-binding protein YceI
METATATTTKTWTLDKAHAKVGFSTVHMLVSDVEGYFSDFDAKLKTTKEDFSDASAEFTAKVSSINTHNEQRDAHLKNADFFQAEEFPTVEFKSKSFTKTGENKYKVDGELTMHGVTKPVNFDVTGIIGEHPFTKKTIAGFKITGSVKRSEFGVGHSVPGFVVSDEVKVVANAEFAGE